MLDCLQNQRQAKAEVLKVWSGAPGVPETLPGKMQSQNEFCNNSKMLFSFFIDGAKAIVMKTDALECIKTNYT